MTIEKAVEQILINVSGGVLSADNSVQRVDILPYLAMAINETIGETFDREFVKMIQAKRAALAFNSMPDYSLFYTATCVVEKEDCQTFVQLPYKPQTIAGEVRYIITPCAGYNNFIKVHGSHTIVGFNDFLPNVMFYWHEYSADGFRVYFSADIAANTKVSVQSIVNIEDIPETVEIPGPDDRIKQAIDRATAYFLQQRYGPADPATDAVDTKPQRQ